MSLRDDAMTLEPTHIVFGGAFDPPHAAHVKCARAGLAAFPKATLIVVPGFQPAGASNQHKTPVAPFEARSSMCRLAFSSEATGATQDRIEISEVERDLPSPNYTINLLKHLQRRLEAAPTRQSGSLRARPAMLLGQDQMASFDRWHEPLEILKIADLIVCPRMHPATDSRPGLSAADESRATVKRLNIGIIEQKLDRNRGHKAAEVLQLAPPFGAIFVLDVPATPISSTAIRTATATNPHSSAASLPGAVANYIETNRLYR